jgi:hypothetical protein
MTNRAKTPKPSRRMESLNRYIAAGTSLNDAAKRLVDDRTAESFAELVKRNGSSTRQKLLCMCRRARWAWGPTVGPPAI